jgi:hypothetical protein
MISMTTMTMTLMMNRHVTPVAVKAGLSQSPRNQVDGGGMKTGRESAQTARAVGFPKTALRGDSSERSVNRAATGCVIFCERWNRGSALNALLFCLLEFCDGGKETAASASE